MSQVKKYWYICRLCAVETFDGGVLHVLGGHALKILRLTILLLIWRSLLGKDTVSGTDTAMTISQVLTYTLISAVFSEQLNVITPATTLFWEGSIASRYVRPLRVLPQLISETIGHWIPSLILYSLPVFLPALWLDIRVMPASPLNGMEFILSLFLSISLGFALDFVFASLVIRMQNASWTVYIIRQAMAAILSGALIPFSLLPWGIGYLLEMLPFGSVAGAPLSIWVGAGSPAKLLGLQLFWNVVLWPMAIAAFSKSQERMVSYGG